MPNIETKTVNVDGLEIKYLQLGDPLSSKSTLLVLHGWNTTGTEIWQNTINLFLPQVHSGELCILAPDLPGFGRSESPKENWNVDKYADFVGEFLKVKSIGGAQDLYLLGHSFGGGVATIIAQNQQLTHLFLAAPAVVRNDETKISKNRITKITKFAKKFIKSDFLRKLWYRLIGSPDYAKTSGIMQDIFRVVIKQDLTANLSKINVPTTIIWGDQDKYTPISEAEIVRSRIKNSKLIVLPGINHGIHIYASEKLHQIIIHELGLN